MHFKAHVQGRQYQAQLRCNGGFVMKLQTTLQKLIFSIEHQRCKSTDIREFQILTFIKESIESHLPHEQEIIEKAFEHGVGEGIDDPERPFTGKEYFDLRYGKQ